MRVSSGERGWVVQDDAAEWLSKGERLARRILGQDFELGLLEEIRPATSEHGVSQEELADALSEVVFDAAEKALKGEISEEDHRFYVLGLIFWKLFGKGTELWIPYKTVCGNAVPFELLIMSYGMWRRALSFAAGCGVGSSDAAEALTQTTHATADQLAKNTHRGEKHRIHSVRNYLFAVYIYAILRIAAKSGSIVEFQWSGRIDRSDEGAFMRHLENTILLRELLAFMTVQERRTTIIRTYIGYDWAEVARVLKTSVNAVQKAQSVGLRKAFEACARDLKNLVCRKPAAGAQQNKDKRTGPNGE